MRTEIRFLKSVLAAAGPGAVLLLASPADALAHGTAAHAHRPAEGGAVEKTPWGHAGRAADATRTVNIDMHDSMRFDPAVLQFRRGETVRLVVRNRGRAMHELVLGTETELRRHAEAMRQHPGMEHDEPFMAHVPPGGSAEIVWTFSEAGRFLYGCLLPGHFESGMVGRIDVGP